MRDRFFIDTNILIYFVSNNVIKKNISKDILITNEVIMVNSQVISEFVTVTIKKQILSIADAFKYANEFMDVFEFSIRKKETIKLSFGLMTKHKYSYWDSLILAVALENDCSILYTEDMQDGQIIENKLKIINPFKIEA
ncbi:MAG: twitching motility protein PilT [Candidatus Brocadia sapporoensis]|nr:MAG: twitching motility protein PilT [Candidatus Brocadia sapporoensis]